MLVSERLQELLFCRRNARPVCTVTRPSRWNFLDNGKQVC